jgi:hypothetical protein
VSVHEGEEGGDTNMEGANELRCHVIRYLGGKKCVIRLCDTGAIIPIVVDTGLDVDRSVGLHPLRGVDATVILGRFEVNGWFHECALDIQWETRVRECFPPPQRYHMKGKRSRT